VELVGEDRAARLVAACDAQAGVVAGLQRQVADRGPAGALEDRKRATGRPGFVENGGRLGDSVADELLVDASRHGQRAIDWVSCRSAISRTII
jgi:hypothetical protein